MDESMALFEEGMKLEQLCGERLDKAELRINELVSRDGEITGVKRFEAEES
jgi:exodeoxyribonuclease VII small subunit